MAVMNMLMPLAGLIKVRYRGDKADIDSPFFKLHYRTTCTLLFIGCILVTANDLIGNTIDCFSSTIPSNVLNSYCWIMSTFSVPNVKAYEYKPEYGMPESDWYAFKAMYQQAYPGVGTWIEEESEVVKHAYYQWVPFVLFLQGVMFYIPHYFWKIFEDRLLDKITKGLRGPTLSLDERKEQCETLVKYMKETFHMHNFYAIKYFVCDLLNLINTIGQIYLINRFLGGVFLSYGHEVLKWSLSETENRTDPMIDVFPRITKCTFHKYGPSGTIEKHDAMCVLPLNIINEKIYVMLWFWFIILAVLTSLHMLYILAAICIPCMRRIMLERKTKYNIKDRIDVLMCKAQMGDWFLIFLLSKNLDSIMFKEFIDRFTDILKTEGGPTEDILESSF